MASEISLARSLTNQYLKLFSITEVCVIVVWPMVLMSRVFKQINWHENEIKNYFPICLKKTSVWENFSVAIFFCVSHFENMKNVYDGCRIFFKWRLCCMYLDLILSKLMC